MVSTSFFRLAAAAALVAALSTDAVTAAPRIDPRVHRALQRQATVNIMVTLKESNENVINSVHEASFPSRGDKIKSLVDNLKKHASTTQTEVSKVVVAESSALFTSARSHWITNQVSFQGATIELIEKLAVMPSVSAIREELVLPVPRFTTSMVKANTTASNDTAPVAPVVKNQWGVKKVQASDVWAAGFNGQGVVVGHIDTGVQYTHEALVGNYRGAYGWFDPTSNNTKTEPYDDIGHGTFTLGSLVGSKGIGVAPGATWMSCRGCTPEGCKESDLIACGEYMTCPTDASGNNRDCAKAPRLVSCSWGGPGGDPFYEGVIKTWQAAEIIPVFANGNIGPDCSTTNSPADSPNVIAVGMTDRLDSLDFSSSKGPAVSGLIKPDISAPGAGVKSAWKGEGDNWYNVDTGTSIAAPYVSGVIAVLLSAKPSLTYAEVKKTLMSTTDTATLAASGYTCGDTEDTTFPNNQYGYGRVNALKAFNAATGSQATPEPTPAPTVCDNLFAFFPCIRQKGCMWSEDGECVLAPPSSASGSGSYAGSHSNSGSGEQPTDAPTDAPTDVPTEAPTPEPTTEVPTSTPEPTTEVPTPAPSV